MDTDKIDIVENALRRLDKLGVGNKDAEIILKTLWENGRTFGYNEGYRDAQNDANVAPNDMTFKEIIRVNK